MRSKSLCTIVGLETNLKLNTELNTYNVSCAPKTTPRNATRTAAAAGQRPK